MKICIFVLIFVLLFSISDIYAQNSKAEKYQLSLGAKFMSRFTAYGIDLAEDKEAISLASSLYHKSGVSLGAHITQPLSDGEDLRQWSVSLGYERDVIPNLTFSAEYSHYFYNSDSVNILSSFSDAISLGADIDLNYFDIGFSYDQFLGSSGAVYFGFDISTFFKAGPLYILPMVQISFISQTVEDQFLINLKGRKKGGDFTQTTETTFSGLASTITTFVVIYPLSDNLYASFIPTTIWSHQEDLAADSFRFVWSAGIRYRLSF